MQLRSIGPRWYSSRCNMVKEILLLAAAWILSTSVRVESSEQERVSETLLGGGSSATLIFNAGTNITLNCEGKDPSRDVAWIQYGKKVLPSSRIRHEADGRLIIDKVYPRDEGFYLCQDVESNQSIHSIRLRIRSPPERVANFSVLPRSVFALATWNTPPSDEEDDLPLLKYSLSLRRDRSGSMDPPEWRETDVPGGENSFTLYDLEPNSTYFFRITAVNALGPGESVSLMASTTYDAEEVRAAQTEAASAQETKPLAFKVWVGGLGLLILLSVVGAMGISIFLIKLRGRSRNDSNVGTTEEEAMELVPHITLNPSFNIDMLEYIQAEEGPVNEEGRRNTEEDGANIFSLPNG